MIRRLRGAYSAPGRLRVILAVLFLALALPTAAVIWQAYGQLKWEAFHQYRVMAEELSSRINDDLSARVAAAEARPFASYSFLNVSGDPEAGFLQRSPLSEWPVLQDLPGVLGYFQVDSSGGFSTPLLPEPGSDLGLLGISPEDLDARRSRASLIQDLLADSRLEAGGDAAEDALGQALFDALATGARLADADRKQADSRPAESAPVTAQERQYSKVQELRLDETLQQKSEQFEAEELDLAAAREAPVERVNEPEFRKRRVEQSALPASPQPEVSDDGPVNTGRLITTFESEVDPFEFASLASGELVLYRKVWRGGERTVQGMLLDREVFTRTAIEAPYRNSSLLQAADQLVALNDDVINVATVEGELAYYPGNAGLQGDLLYRARLPSPLDAIQVIYTLKKIPRAPGATVLSWTTGLVAAVFGFGFLLLYRLGMGQIALARQQQDFVSSVSHELKTPLTSIRMYSEMLKEGWADEARRQQYYAFIHDESERLSRLIANVLQLSSITRGQPALDLRPVSGRELLDGMQSKIQGQVDRAGFELEISLDEGAPEVVVEVDQDCMAQIVTNLVDNAIKFSRHAQTRRIEIGARVDTRRRLRISVRDHGPGIPKEQMKKIFRLFYRPESELTRETVGTGIGLAIVHQLAQAMGGEVEVLNREPGAEFVVILPTV